MRLSLSRDGWLLFATSEVRSFAYGFLSVVLGLYLDTLGLSATAIGWIFTAALAGGSMDFRGVSQAKTTRGSSPRYWRALGDNLLFRCPVIVITIEP